MFKRNFFDAKCKECELKTDDVARIIGVNPATLYRKLTGKSDFTRNEIQLFRCALKLSSFEVDAIFFAQ